MNKEFLPYDLSLEMKELGFNEPCLGLYREDSSFLYADVFSFREPYSPSEFKEGVDEGVYYINSEILEELVAASTFSQAFRWFRENHGYYVSVFRTHDNNWGVDLWLLGVHKPKATIFSETYEEAELACLNKLIEIVKDK